MSNARIKKIERPLTESQIFAQGLLTNLQAGGISDTTLDTSNPLLAMANPFTMEGKAAYDLLTLADKRTVLLGLRDSAGDANLSSRYNHLLTMVVADLAVAPKSEKQETDPTKLIKDIMKKPGDISTATGGGFRSPYLPRSIVDGLPIGQQMTPELIEAYNKLGIHHTTGSGVQELLMAIGRQNQAKFDNIAQREWFDAIVGSHGIEWRTDPSDIKGGLKPFIRTVDGYKLLGMEEMTLQQLQDAQAAREIKNVKNPVIKQMLIESGGILTPRITKWASLVGQLGTGRADTTKHEGIMGSNWKEIQRVAEQQANQIDHNAQNVIANIQTSARERNSRMSTLRVYNKGRWYGIRVPQTVLGMNVENYSVLKAEADRVNQWVRDWIGSGSVDFRLVKDPKNAIESIKARISNIHTRNMQRVEEAKILGETAGVSSEEAIRIAGDVQQGKQILLDMINFQNRLSGMSQGVVT